MLFIKERRNERMQQRRRVPLPRASVAAGAAHKSPTMRHFGNRFSIAILPLFFTPYFFPSLSLSLCVLPRRNLSSALLYLRNPLLLPHSVFSISPFLLPSTFFAILPSLHPHPQSSHLSFLPSIPAIRLAVRPPPSSQSSLTNTNQSTTRHSVSIPGAV